MNTTDQVCEHRTVDLKQWIQTQIELAQQAAEFIRYIRSHSGTGPEFPLHFVTEDHQTAAALIARVDLLSEMLQDAGYDVTMETAQAELIEECQEWLGLWDQEGAGDTQA